ncbi:hypothetical protein GE300_22055 [Rhodobacteraceae bacterium 2CG4]|uniref:Uncharacterized protein n=1 Tax=Halovulum marinum TaxID=2662447 RepID=A0A6L5Z6M5_9RHOB|nr:hypothetical protein [Halovulum marinum]
MPAEISGSALRSATQAEISAACTLPETYADFSCSQVHDESRRVSSRTAQVAGAETGTATDA